MIARRRTALRLWPAALAVARLIALGMLGQSAAAIRFDLPVAGTRPTARFETSATRTAPARFTTPATAGTSTDGEGSAPGGRRGGR